MKKDIFSYRLLASRIKSENVQKSERIFGYFIGPCIVSIVSTALFGSYLIQFYTDVLSLTGGVLTWLPLVSNVIGGLMGLFVGGWIDRTRTAQGKAHPWLLLSALLMPLAGLLLYNVPAAHGVLQNAWVVVSYIFYFGIVGAFNTLSHSLLIPLSTRNVEERDRLVMLSSTASSMIPGCLSTFVLPLAIRAIGIGAEALQNWRTVMSLLALLLLPAILLEYYFTRERITEPPKPKAEQADFLLRLKACFTNRKWLLLLLFMVSQSFFSAFFNSSTIYYCNWVLCDSVQQGTDIQVLVH
ncbi:MAG: MFS transporter, partial [Clostridia bacterium]|nr:MFS transporter [Clostridia bacterium]